MSDTSGPGSQVPFALYDPNSSCWRTSQITFDSVSEPYLGTWPRQGMTRNGEAFEQPTSVLPMPASASSSWLDPLVQEFLPTPTTDDAGNSAGRESGEFQSLASEVQGLLPTPTASEGTGAGHATEGGKNLRTTLLPTPTRSDGERSGHRGGRSHSGQSLTDVVARDQMQLLPTPNPFHMTNSESPEEWLARRAEVQERTGTRHGPALPVVARSIEEGHPLYQAGEGPTLWNTDPTEEPSSGGSVS